jgi:hypothetical protein
MKILHVADTSIYNYDDISSYINELLECAYKGGDQLLVLSTVPINPKNRRIVNHKAEVKEFRNLKFFSSDKFIFSMPGGMKKALNGFEPDIARGASGRPFESDHPDQVSECLKILST